MAKIDKVANQHGFTVKREKVGRATWYVMQRGKLTIRFTLAGGAWGRWSVALFWHPELTIVGRGELDSPPEKAAAWLIDNYGTDMKFVEAALWKLRDRLSPGFFENEDKTKGPAWRAQRLAWLEDNLVRFPERYSDD